MNQTKENMKYQEKAAQQEKRQTAFQQEKQTAGKVEKAVFKVDSEAETDRKLRSPRSEIYLQLFDLVDLLSATDEEIIRKIKENLDEETAEEMLEMPVEEVKEEIRQSFTEEFETLQVEAESVLLGVLSKCYIRGCDCHAITSEGTILDHYRQDAPLPMELEKGRKILKRYQYQCKCVEVYRNCCRVVMLDSSVVTVKDREC